ncbi:ATP-binding sensor histidine kinase [Oscillatoria sp. FACHB-1406]|uniref:trifunctional serine/threonine-protein kinase/ATP-binding protein/sensor histidine kinase n=1 Tax=Oscillatoria sp. FACHB-1406 TaxID=2692846 RepID=UPI001682BF9C|nr:ATP-binding sensor histidine kinase [Oscillatoria sp. FACHB-1406]MBD2578035.1 AAA family ATPase [Oscillatoria sp. FACHB-1406]
MQEFSNSEPPRLPQLPGYTLLEPLYCGSRTLVYRAVQLADRQPVVIKFLRQTHPTFSELVQFRNQYAVAKNLNFSGIIRPLSLKSWQNSYALVMEDTGSISLAQYIQTHPLDISATLNVGIQLAEILHQLHAHRIIHKDIKPANLLIHSDSQHLQLIDFSIASLLPKETQKIQNPNVLEGTLAYLSPEQTGRMNRVIDYRTDFYSVGVTLYELLTGQLPFQAEEPLDLVYCHIAQSPIPPHELKPEISPQLSAIVLKLMAKNAEDRYLTALGFQYDLQQCLNQWEETGNITAFELGLGDLCDSRRGCAQARLLVPEKLYGRESEVSQLLEAFERVSGRVGDKTSIHSSHSSSRAATSEIMLVAGFSGIGKTAVINEVHKPIVRQRGYFIKGKFDQFNRDLPLSAFVQAFRDLIGQLLGESDARLEEWKTQILDALRESGQAIINTIPELERIIGKQPPVPELSGTAAQNRFNVLFEKFVRVFAKKEHPLVIFLDDLQWVDPASLNLLQLLTSEANGGYLLILGAYRDNEVDGSHPLMLSLDEIRKAGAVLNTIGLLPLAERTVNQLVADTLNCSLEIAQPLVELVYQKTQGNPFFINQFLKASYEEGWIRFQPELKRWQYNPIGIRQVASSDNVMEFLGQQLQKLPALTQEVLKLAACIGNQFDLETLAIVCEQSPVETATDLWRALEEELVLPQSEGYKFYLSGGEGENYASFSTTALQSPTYKFTHDRIQQAAYSLIPESQKQATHHQIGQLLLNNYSNSETSERLLEIVRHLNLARDFIARQQDRDILARLNLQAAQKALASTAYEAAEIYLQAGLELLAADCWQEQYELALELHVTATSVAYTNGHFQKMEQRASIVLQHARTLLEKVKIYELKISALNAQSQLSEAVDLGRSILKQLGVELSAETKRAQIEQGLQTIIGQLNGKAIEELVNLPVMEDRQTLAAMQLLGSLFVPIRTGVTELLPSLASRMVELSLQFGNAPMSAMGYIVYGIVLCDFLGDVETGYRFGRLAIALLEREDLSEAHPTSPLKAIISAIFTCYLQHQKESLRDARLTAKKSYTAAMEVGDFLYAIYNIHNYFFSNFLAGVELDAWIDEIANYSTVLSKYKQDSGLMYFEITRQAAYNCWEVVPQPELLIGEAYDETVMLEWHRQNHEVTALGFAYIYKLMLAYQFDRDAIALEYLSQAQQYLIGVTDTPFVPLFHFYAALTDLKLLPATLESERAEMFRQVEIHQTQLHQWAVNAPMNHLHKWHLVEAEKYRVLGNKAEAIEQYDRAIASARANESLQEEALARELAAKFYRAWGKEKIAADYFQEAYSCYIRWGSKPKLQHLEECYRELLAPILPVEVRTLELNAPSTIGTKHSTSATSSDRLWLDFPAVMKAARALSQEIALEKLLPILRHIAMTYAGATKGTLIVRKPDIGWVIVEYLYLEGSQGLLEIPLDGYPDLPQSLVYSVARTQKTAVFDNLSDLEQFASDRYVMLHQPKSVLCAPILRQGQAIGILYLENDLAFGAFTEERLEILQIITAQAAISIENARLYREVENYSQELQREVGRKTKDLQRKAKDLEEALQSLRRTQSQLIQSEKMSALGQLVAGVAHEINNPVNFINANIYYTGDYMKSLFELLKVYQEEYPEPNEKIEAKKEEMELSFIEQDLIKVLESMKAGANRIKQLVLSLRNFSRLDESEMKQVDIHEGLDNTLLILQHRLKATPGQPQIAITKNYGKLPLLNCYASQLNQVFLNIIGNAIDVLRLPDAPKTPEIRIMTEVARGNTVRIAIADNGSGMSESIQQKVFDPFFTTKPVGKGTGLGLAIGYQIVTEQHGGQLYCTSHIGQGTEFAIEIPL